MLKDVMVNGAMLIAMIHIGNLYYRYRIVEADRATLAERCLLGLACGVAGIVMMTFTVRISDTTILDARHIPVVLAAANGGFPAAAVAGALVAAFRLIFFGAGTTAYLAAANVLLYAAVCGWIATLGWSRMRAYTAMNAVAISGSVTVFAIVLPPELLGGTLISYVLYSAVAGALVYLLMENIIVTNELFQRFKRQSTTDFLTGLNNVRRFDIALNEAVGAAAQRGERLSLLMIDIDFFKSVNDTFGHKAGDDVLRELGKTLTEHCRSVDTVSRNGGEEFSVLLPDCAIERAQEVAERLRAAVEAHPFPIEGGSPLRITISIGAAAYPDDAMQADELLRRADDGLYRAKRTGRNRVCAAPPATG